MGQEELLMSKSCPREPGFVYHATSAARLKKITREGLQARPQPVCHADEARCTKESVVFFAMKPEGAAVWGSEVLRFPEPPDWAGDDYSDTTIYPDGRIGPSQGYTDRGIPPSDLAVCRRGRWEPLRK